MKSEMDKLCKKMGVKISSQYGAVEIPDGWFAGTHPYQVKLKYQGRKIKVPFFMGPAHCKEPTAGDVLSCLVMDATGVENSTSFEDWCSDYGYDSDSRKTLKTYKACKKVVVKVRRLLGEDFDLFTSAEH